MGAQGEQAVFLEILTPKAIIAADFSSPICQELRQTESILVVFKKQRLKKWRI